MSKKLKYDVKTLHGKQCISLRLSKGQHPQVCKLPTTQSKSWLRLSIQHITRIRVISRRTEQHNHQTLQNSLWPQGSIPKKKHVPHIMSKRKCIQHVNGKNKDGNEVLTISPNWLHRIKRWPDEKVTAISDSTTYQKTGKRKNDSTH